MGLLRIREVEILGPGRLRLTLTDGSEVDRDVSALLKGPMFEELAADPVAFGQARVDGGTVVWANGADLCPDVLIWGAAPPENESEAPLDLRLRIAPS